MTDEIVREVKAINKEEMGIRTRKFEIMRKLEKMSWEQVQSEVIAYLEEQRNVNA